MNSADCVLGESLAALYLDAAYKNSVLVLGEPSVICSGAIIFDGCEFGSPFATGKAAAIHEHTRVSSIQFKLRCCA